MGPHGHFSRMAPLLTHKRSYRPSHPLLLEPGLEPNGSKWTRDRIQRRAPSLPPGPERALLGPHVRGWLLFSRNDLCQEVPAPLLQLDSGQAQLLS